MECKEFKPKTITKDFAGYIVLSNHDASLHIEMGNKEYFKHLEKILNNSNTSGVFINYLLKRGLLDWIPQRPIG
ncbi:hypothetical protein RhiirA5_438093 [Rhizophagus irregularis]|uniref:Uncharacterized protein n=1 Tax=Rhizophagus irregularis TaxID=588596 RepID=A0A2N0NJL0_9GLOM|nr:hypothetical protein RhiirA5_438093 [Rhizophagus irregularis]